MKKIIKFLLKIIIILLILIGLFTLYLTLSDYEPKEKIIISQGENVSPIEENNITMFSWNIGYAGLGQDMDFFYDGGEKTRCTKQQTIKNLKEIRKVITDYSYSDFIFLQEIDEKSKRSYYLNEKDSIEKTLNDFISFFATNYKVQYIPFPLFSPMGQVNSGLAIYSKDVPVSSVRYKYPGNYSWPKKIFMPDRCFICNKYILDSGRKLIIINLHNSAYDKTKSLRKKQLEYLKKFIVNEYKKSNYVIVGGDWNINTNFIKKDFLPHQWQCIYDTTLKTNRALNDKYIENKTKTKTIDFFIISPNVLNTSIETINLNFKNSDHNPIIGEFKLKKQ